MAASLMDRDVLEITSIFDTAMTSITVSVSNQPTDNTVRVGSNVRDPVFLQSPFPIETSSFDYVTLYLPPFQ